MDDESPQPKPRPVKKSSGTSSASSTAAPRRRPPVRKAPASAATGDASVLTNSPFIDPLLQPVVDGTPVEIPVIVPSWLDEDEPAAAPVAAVVEASPVEVAPAVELPTLAAVTSAPAPTEVVEVVEAIEVQPEPEAAPAAAIHAPKPVTVPRGRRPRVRRVTRVVRQIDTWSVFKVALLFSLFLYAVCLTAGVLLWQVAQNTGTVDNVERFFESFGWQSFQLKGGELYHNAWVGGLFLVVGLTGLLVLAATMFNLIAELVGGIRVTVLEEEVIAREERGLGWRRGSRRHAEAADAGPDTPAP